MKLNPFSFGTSASPASSSRHDAAIDAALRLYGGAVPGPGFEGRVAARLGDQPRHAFHSKSAPRLAILRGLSTAALAAAAACGMVIGTVRHSHHALPPQAARVPHVGGLNSAGASRLPTHATPQSPSLDPQAPRTAPRHRATVSPGHAPSQAPAAGLQQQ
jgi:hypothetical protein